MKRPLCAVLALLALGYGAPSLSANSGQLVNVRQQFINASGAPLASGAVYLYQAGTSTPVTSYQDPALTIANTNPIILDSNGMASIWLAPGNYREVVADSLGNQLFDGTTSTTAYATSLTPGATIGTSGDAVCTATQFTGASNITLPCTVTSASTATAGKVQLTTNAVAQAGASTSQAVTPAALASITQGQAQTYVADTGGSSNTVVAAPTPAWTAYTAGEVLQVKLANALTGAATVNVSGLGTKSIKVNGNDPSGIASGQIVTLTYDGTFFQLQPLPTVSSWAIIQGSTTGSCAVLAGYNVSSCTRNAKGDYSVSFGTSRPSANYAPIGMAQCLGTNCTSWHVVVSGYEGLSQSVAGYRVTIIPGNSADALGSAVDPDLLFVMTLG